VRVVGLTGGLASGKSTFASALRARGVPVVDADAIAREVVRPGSPALARLVEELGEGVLDADGALDRRAVAARVFSDREARRRLEAITHPAIRSAMVEETARLAAAGHELAFYDAPLLFEVGLDAALDSVVVVWAPAAAQRARAVARGGLTPEEAEARLAAQLPLDEKARRADFVVVNDGPPEALDGKAARLLDDLRKGLGRKLPNAHPVRY
jgi:dephospho-CoA kinase